MAQPKSKRTIGEGLNHSENGTNEGGNLAKLLLNALKSEDQSTIESVITVEENLIIHAVHRLSTAIIQELIKEVTSFIRRRRSLYCSGSLWLKYLIQENTIVLMSCSNLPELLNPVKSIIEERTAFQDSLLELQGTIGCFLRKIDRAHESSETLISNDEDLSDSQEFILSEFQNKDEDSENVEDTEDEDEE